MKAGDFVRTNRGNIETVARTFQHQNESWVETTCGHRWKSSGLTPAATVRQCECWAHWEKNSYRMASLCEKHGVEYRNQHYQFFVMDSTNAISSGLAALHRWPGPFSYGSCDGEGLRPWQPPDRGPALRTAAELKFIECLCPMLVALHAPPKLCVYCGKGPASFHNSYYSGPLCVYCGWRNSHPAWKEHHGSAVASLTAPAEAPGPYEDACAWESPGWDGVEW